MIALALLLLAAPTPTKSELASMTQLLAGAAANDDRVDVLTREDLQKAADVEADRQLTSCKTGESCLSELAEAMDARVVVFGSISPLGDGLVVHIATFDAESARSLGRSSKRVKNLDAAGPVVEKLGAKLVRDAVAAKGASREKPLRILVVDLTVAGADEDAEDDEEAGGNGTAIGLSVVGAGVAALGAGVACDLWGQTLFVKASNDLALPAKDARGAFDAADGFAFAAIGLYAVAAVAIVSGAVVAVTVE